jgi:hypothetical protein
VKQFIAGCGLFVRPSSSLKKFILKSVIKKGGENMYKKIIICVIVIVLLIVGYIFLSSPTPESQRRIDIAKQQLKTAQVEESKAKEEELKANVSFIQTSLDAYYVIYGSYPLKITDMNDAKEMEVQKKGFITAFNKGLQNLKNTQYEVSGDRKAYKFSYIDLNGKNISVEGRYSSDMHKY